MKKALKVGGSIVLVVAALLFVAIKFSAAETRYECSGTFQISGSGTEQAGSLFLKLARYRFWTAMWTDSYGDAWVEVPNQTVDYYGHIGKAGDQLQLWDDSAKQQLQGNFSLLSNSLGVDVGGYGLFQGKCKPI